MLQAIVSFSTLLLASLLAGALFGVFLVLNPNGLDGPHFVALQQQAIRTLNTAMPVLGGATILVTVVAALMTRADPLRLGLLVAAVVAFAVAGLITRFANQPINAVVMTWSAATPPLAWTALRDTWWHWHIVRVLCGLAGLSAVIVETLVATSQV